MAQRHYYLKSIPEINLIAFIVINMRDADGFVLNHCFYLNAANKKIYTFLEIFFMQY